MRTIKGVKDMQEIARELRLKGGEPVLVPTMGFLHGGHRELLRAGKREGGPLVLSIFVNPAQFGPGEDYGAYPRDIERDSKLAADEGVDVVFSPEAGEMYPDGFETHVEPGGLSARLCGLTRPGHFRGVLTVVLKLFSIVMPAKAVFGMKDYQQQLLIRRMAGDFNLDVEIISIDTVREADGLAMSSRNSYLSKEERKAALCIPRSLDAAREAFSGGQREAPEIIAGMKKIIEKEPCAVVEYIKVCDKDSLEDLGSIRDSALAAVAVRIGKARLIDNCILSTGSGGFRA